MKTAYPYLLLLWTASLVHAAALPAPAPEKVQSLHAAQEAARRLLPAEQRVDMRIDHSRATVAMVAESVTGLRLEVDFSGRSAYISGDIKTTAHRRHPRDSRYGVDLLGGGINVSLSPFGGSYYILNGIYDKGDGKNSSLNIPIKGYYRDMEIRQPGMDLNVKWRASGYRIEGTVDPARYGKKELAILGGALTALTHGEFWQLP
ncbi:MAG: hypothetical protein HY551_07535 [Elusimicrobia bacterium]|nr:hypothetical protein [Elusimicrobiota bacterium]